MKHLATSFAITLAACSSSLPTRYVIERDLSPYHYRRYQETLDAEIPIAGNRAHGHTAAYLKRSARGVDAISAFVTVYERPAKLTERLRSELAALPGFELKTEKVAGQYAWLLASSSDASFWVWPSGQYVVKLGAPVGQRLPDSIAEPYADLYPSDLDSFGHAREGAASGGSEPEAEEKDEATPNPSEKPSTLAEAKTKR
ncbi:MAG TPA: hypothetical protein VFN67_41835 [Polyangiales bacterium]|nr:hypothetical protein [Polyangiales bacterium]